MHEVTWKNYVFDFRFEEELPFFFFTDLWMILELRLIETIVSFLRFKYLVEMDRFVQIVCKFQ